MSDDRCACGCQASAHQHYRHGSDCGTCGEAVCARYMPVADRRRELAAALGVAVVVPALVLGVVVAAVYGGSAAAYALLAFLVLVVALAASRG